MIDTIQFLLFNFALLKLIEFRLKHQIIKRDENMSRSELNGKILFDEYFWVFQFEHKLPNVRP